MSCVDHMFFLVFDDALWVDESEVTDMGRATQGHAAALRAFRATACTMNDDWAASYSSRARECSAPAIAIRLRRTSAAR